MKNYFHQLSKESNVYQQNRLRLKGVNAFFVFFVFVVVSGLASLSFTFHQKFTSYEMNLKHKFYLP